MISLARSWAVWPVSSWQPKELAFYAKDMLDTKQGASHAVICGSQGHSVTLEYRIRVSECYVQEELVTKNA